MNASTSAFWSAAARPASVSARSGTIAFASPSAVATRSRTASRYESVATRTTPSRLISRDPGQDGPRLVPDAARATCPTASENAAGSTEITVPDGSWTPGKSSAGGAAALRRKRRSGCAPGTGPSRSPRAPSEGDFTVSASNRAGTSAVPASWTCTPIVSRAETSRSVVVRVSVPSSAASSNTPVRAGSPAGRTHRAGPSGAPPTGRLGHTGTSSEPPASSVLLLEER